MGKPEDSIPALEAYVHAHPADALGYYELAEAEHTRNSVKALAALDKAISLDPRNVAARRARGGLYYQEGKPKLALKDLEIAVSLSPDDPLSLDRLGQTYHALDRVSDALPVLRKAAQFAPEDPQILLHLGRVLAKAGQTEESRRILDRFRQLGPPRRTGVPQASSITSACRPMIGAPPFARVSARRFAIGRATPPLVSMS